MILKKAKICAPTLVELFLPDQKFLLAKIFKGKKAGTEGGKGAQKNNSLKKIASFLAMTASCLSQ